MVRDKECGAVGASGRSRSCYGDTRGQSKSDVSVLFQTMRDQNGVHPKAVDICAFAPIVVVLSLAVSERHWRQGGIGDGGCLSGGNGGERGEHDQWDALKKYLKSNGPSRIFYCVEGDVGSNYGAKINVAVVFSSFRKHHSVVRYPPRCSLRSQPTPRLFVVHLRQPKLRVVGRNEDLHPRRKQNRLDLLPLIEAREQSDIIVVGAKQ
mmetsp:Transcript_76451/g.153497  ORF Transcript_76451/g.153497 Transcript_76451/m.153497 type:complete len:208 (-) Transcript_76451:2222-2845(-)